MAAEAEEEPAVDVHDEQARLRVEREALVHVHHQEVVHRAAADARASPEEAGLDVARGVRDPHVGGEVQAGERAAQQHDHDHAEDHGRRVPRGDGEHEERRAQRDHERESGEAELPQERGARADERARARRGSVAVVLHVASGRPTPSSRLPSSGAPRASRDGRRPRVRAGRPVQPRRVPTRRAGALWGTRGAHRGTAGRSRPGGRATGPGRGPPHPDATRAPPDRGPWGSRATGGG